MRKSLVSLLLLVLVSGLIMPYAGAVMSDTAENHTSAAVDQTVQQTPSDVAYLPLSEVVDVIGGYVKWDETTQTATIEDFFQEKELSFTVGESRFVTDGESFSMSGPARLVDDEIHLPADGVGKAFRVDADTITDLVSKPEVQEDLFGVAANRNGTLVAVGDKGVILYSTDGVNWKQADSPTNRPIRQVIANGTVFMAVGDGGAVLRSKDGIHWRALDVEGDLRRRAFLPSTVQGEYTEAELEETFRKEDITFTDLIWDGTRYIATGYVKRTFSDGYTRTGMILAVSVDGVNWRVDSLNRRISNQEATVGSGAVEAESIRAMATSGNDYVIVGDGFVLVSDRLAKWEVIEGIRGHLFDVLYDGKRYIGVGWDGALGRRDEKQRTTGIVYVSGDGRTWKEIRTEHDLGVVDRKWAEESLDFNGFAFISLNTVLHDEGSYLAGGTLGAVLRSDDERNWKMATSLHDLHPGAFSPFYGETYDGRHADLNDMTVYRDGYIAVGDAGAILSSRSGKDWGLSHRNLPDAFIRQRDDRFRIEARPGLDLGALVRALEREDRLSGMYAIYRHEGELYVQYTSLDVSEGMSPEEMTARLDEQVLERIQDEHPVLSDPEREAVLQSRRILWMDIPLKTSSVETFKQTHAAFFE